MNKIMAIMIMLLLFFFSYSFSDDKIEYPPLEDIAGGEESCKKPIGDKCKPWVVDIAAVKNNAREIKSCSGSLISPKHVLTARHCKNEGAESYKIYDYDNEEIGVVHKDKFFTYGDKHDFAIMEMEKDSNLEEYGRVRRFFDYDEAHEKLDKNYYQSSVYGYGFRGVNRETGEEEDNKGDKQYRADTKITSFFMDGYSQPGLMIDTIEGQGLVPGTIQSADSGGPIIWRDTIIGITSWGYDAPEVKTEIDYYLPFGATDITGKHNDIFWGKKYSLGNWFSETMKQIWIENPDWKAHLTKRGDSILIEGWGRPGSKIKLSYRIDGGQENGISCQETVNKTGKWKCSIPRNDFFTGDFNEEKDHDVIITAKEDSTQPSTKLWREDSVKATIPAISEEFSIIYPADKTTVLTKNFTVRGYADPGSSVQFVLQSNIDHKSFTQEQLCQNLNNDNLIQTTDYGAWQCTINAEVLGEINIYDDEKKWNFKITASQNTKSDVNIYDQVEIRYQPKEYGELKIIENDKDMYRKMSGFEVNYDDDANFLCVFKAQSFDCKKNGDNRKTFYLDNPKLNNLIDFPIGAIQKINNADPLDTNLYFTTKGQGEYYNPTFKSPHKIEDIQQIYSYELNNKKTLKGFGGDNKKYILPDKTVYLPSEYSICMKRTEESPWSPGEVECEEYEDKDKYRKIILETGQYFDNIPIIYGYYQDEEKNNFPTWDITLPSTLEEGVYYIEINDKKYLLGWEDKKVLSNKAARETSRSFFEIKRPQLKITSPSQGETDTVGTSTHLSGRANEPGGQVVIKKPRLGFLPLAKDQGNLSGEQETIICNDAVVTDNGNWNCDKPIIFPAGSYELTAELVKEGKVIATDVTHLTIKDKSDDEPEKKKFEIKSPKNNSEVDPDNPITVSGTLSGPDGGGGGGGGFGGFISGLVGGFFGSIGSLINTLLSGGLGFFWELVLPLGENAGEILGGDTYTLTLQETDNKLNIGNPITWTFTVPIRIMEPAAGAQYRVKDKISIQGQGSPKQLILVASSQYFLPAEKFSLIPRDGIICIANVDNKGKWTCPDNPVITAANEGTFFLYAAQYKKTGTGELGDIYERTSQVRRKYEVAKTKIQITTPAHGTKITKLPFMISGTGEKGAQVHIGGFGGSDNCKTTIDASSGKWSCGPYQPKEGKYTISANQFIHGDLTSSDHISFEVQTKKIIPVVITQPHNGEVYHRFDSVLPQGTGESGTTICLDKKVLSQVCKQGVAVDKQGNWQSNDGLDTSIKGKHKLVATAFLDGVRQSTATVIFDILSTAGDTTLTVKSPKEGEVIKTPSYTFSGTMPNNAKAVTVKAFGGRDDCHAKLNKENNTWSCGPYSSVPGNYDVTVEDDTGSSIDRGFKVRYGPNLQMQVLNPTEGEQIHTPTYTIKGTGQTGAGIFVFITGTSASTQDKFICNVYVDGNQQWTCPTTESVPGKYHILAQQWVDNVPSGKPVTRNYEVGNGITEITIDPTAYPGCTAPNSNQNATTNTAAIISMGSIPVMQNSGSISIPITGTATKGAHISLKAKSADGKSWHCGAVQASEIDGKWRCTIHNAQLGTYQVSATQSIKFNNPTSGTSQIGQVSASILDITWPLERGVLYDHKPPITVSVKGTARPNMDVSYKIQSSESFVPFGDIKKGKVTADAQGNWDFDAVRHNLGWQKIDISASFCDQPTSFERNFKLRLYLN
ncbi:trypsin-like serine protease [Xenorhabdus sp. Reich]|uniref:Trypsin-like serine protease n=1 Tax=Xenorhabdus littoralis TaxID=2582835 RepID=A0ABU4SI66_9GAMM|nr:trypsin-like serine protease [Xenorhabdus sp. Reich]MDX7998353.1 trypsin-like serine protease [Xenorhabdus sp. Reich]